MTPEVISKIEALIEEAVHANHTFDWFKKTKEEAGDPVFRSPNYPHPITLSKAEMNDPNTPPGLAAGIKDNRSFFAKELLNDRKYGDKNEAAAKSQSGHYVQPNVHKVKEIEGTTPRNLRKIMRDKSNKYPISPAKI